MNSNNDSQEQFIEKIEADNLVSLDDFIKELEAKEKDLKITSEIFVEIEEYDSFAGSNQRAATPGDSGDAPAKASESGNAGQENFNASSNGQQQQQSQQQFSKELAELRQQVRQLEKEREEMREVLSRRQIDFDNYRKRIERDRHETFRTLVGDLATQMLPVVDNLERALDSSDALSDEKSPEFQHFLDGIYLVDQQLSEVLAEMGIEPIYSVGKAFDPHFHEAAAAEESDEYPPNTVTKELLRGYKMDEKVIRHAVVKVSASGGGNQRPSQPPPQQQQQQQPVFQEIDSDSFKNE
ncbi:MAG: nucleotide exchange factor GrpE [Acidobacteriota bacterium]|nr:nucleotide exchange factor GrpE [Acidobacteriota bacterium]